MGCLGEVVYIDGHKRQSYIVAVGSVLLGRTDKLEQFYVGGANGKHTAVRPSGSEAYRKRTR